MLETKKCDENKYVSYDFEVNCAIHHSSPKDNKIIQRILRDRDCNVYINDAFKAHPLSGDDRRKIARSSDLTFLCFEKVKKNKTTIC